MAVRNVRARILVTRNIPGLPEHEAPMTIWWLGKRFHVRERSGRSFRDVAADVAEPRGLGALPRTAEDFIGAHRFFEGNVEVFGATGEESASVREPWGRTWRCPLDRVSPIAAQILAADLGGYTRGRATRFLDRDCVEYNTVREGSEDGRGFRSKVRLLVADGYVLLREVADGAGSMSLRAAVTDIDEGVVTEADVTS